MTETKAALKQCVRKENCVNALGCWLPDTPEFFHWESAKKRYLETRCKACHNADSTKRTRQNSKHFGKEWIGDATDLIGENWKEVVGYESLYQVSDMGRVRSLPRRNSRGNILRGRILREVPTHYGYLIVMLCHNGVIKRHTVHGLVARAFHGEPPIGSEINHIDFTPTNNRPENLEYCTHAENMKHYHQSSHFLHGEKAPGAKLTEREVLHMRELYAQGLTPTEISRQCGVERRRVNAIVLRRIWKHVKAHVLEVG